MNVKEVFEKEWAIYGLRGAQRDGVWSRKGKTQTGEDSFDAGVKPGEIRIFADMEKPFTALVVEAKGLAGWTIVPISPFTVPASSREMLVGERVLQLWNACVAAKSFVERSWIVDTLAETDLADVKARMETVESGRITAGEGPVAEYERAFLVTGGTFEPIAATVSEKRPAGRAAWKWYGGWSIAAMLLVCLGGMWMAMEDRKEEQEPLPACASVDKNVSLARAHETSLMGRLRREDSHGRRPEAESYRAEKETVQAAFRLRKAAKAPAKMSYATEERCCAVPACAPTCAKSKVSAGRRAHVLMDRGTERYAEFNENEFHDPKSDPLSTFSLDVDTSSYALMRRYLMEQKRLPPKTSVRLEEYVNYFRYSYPQPTGGDPIAVDCEMADCPWNKAHKLLRLGVQAKQIASDKQPPCNLTFLIDRSGSMNSNNGMSLLKTGLNMLVDKLRDCDRVSIVTYASGTEVLLEATPGSEKKKLHSVINSLRASGCTYGAGGLQLAYDEAKRNFDKSANNRVILVTDGDFNVGISSPKELEEFIETKRKSGIFLSVIGVGRGNYQDAGMKKLANAGNGNYAYLDSVLEAKKVMLTEFGGTIFTVAKDVKVQIEFNPAQVAGYRLLGYENRLLEAKDFNDDKKDAGEIGSGHTMTAFYEIIPAGAKETAVASVDDLKYQKRTAVESAEIFTVKMRWKQPDGDTSQVKAVAKTAKDLVRKEPSEDFRFASSVAEFALILGDSRFKGEASFASVLERARKAKGSDDEGYRAEFIRLVEQAEILQ